MDRETVINENIISITALNTRIELLKGYITKQNVDAIVNAANSSLLGGGGVDGVIHRAGGPAILADCRKIVARQGGCKIGEAVIRTGGNLPAKFVTHTIGPLAVENETETVAFPNISTGIYGYSKEIAERIAVKSIRNFFGNRKNHKK